MAASSSSSSCNQDQKQESLDEYELKKDDQFERLPDDLVMLIINKLISVKTLIRFSVVSNRYSSLVFQTDSLFVDWDVYDPGFLGRFLRNLVAKFRRASTTDISTRNTKKVSVMKHDFQQVKHLHLHFCGSPAVFSWVSKGFLSTRWVAAFGSSFEFFNFLIASSVNQSNCKSSIEGSSNYYLHGYCTENSETLFELVIKLLKNLRARHEFIRTLVLDHQHQMLETVVFSDDDLGGNFIMGKENIAKLRSNLEVSAYPVDLNVSVTHVPTLHLPETGYTMNDVILVSAVPNDHQDGEIVEVMDAEDEETMEVKFLDDSVLNKFEVLDEAVRQIVNENRTPMYVSQIPCNVLQ